MNSIVGDENLRRIASRAFRDIMPSSVSNRSKKLHLQTPKLRGLKLSSIENLDYFGTTVGNPIPAPKPAAVTTMRCWEISTELFLEQHLKNQSRKCHSLKSPAAIQNSNDTSPVTSASGCQIESYKEECPIPAPKPAASCSEILKELFLEQWCLKNQQKNYYSSKSSFPVQNSIATSSLLSVDCRQRESYKDECPILAPKPAAVPTESCWEISTELFLDHQQRNSYSSRLHFATQNSNYTSPSANHHQRESYKDECPIPAPKPAERCWENSTELFLEQQCPKNQHRDYYSSKSPFPVQNSSDTSSAMSQSIFTTDAKKQAVPKSLNAKAFQHGQYNDINGGSYPSNLLDTDSSEEMESPCKSFPLETSNMSYYAYLTFKAENERSVNPHNTFSEEKPKAISGEYHNGYNSVTKAIRENLDVPQSDRVINGADSSDMSCVPENIQKVGSEHTLSSNNSSGDKNIKITDDMQSPWAEAAVKTEKSSSDCTVSKRMFLEIHKVHQDYYQRFKIIANQAKQREYRPYLRKYNVRKLQTLSPEVGFIDTHCHLDFLFKRARHSDSFEAYRKKFNRYFPESYEGCVAVFCDPHTFAQENIWRSLIEEDGVWASFGCHPHNAMDYTEKVHASLITALEHKKVKALGEIGLDYSDRNKCPKAIQHQVFKKQLKLAIDKNLPLVVIHNREAFEDCLEIMKKHVPVYHMIHLHCCTDSWKVAKAWLDAFPNLYIGISNMVTYSTARNVHDVARNIPLDRLLLETDAPYFVPSSLPKNDLRWSHPGMAIHVAAQVTVLRQNISLDDVLRVVRWNTMKVYRI